MKVMFANGAVCIVGNPRRPRPPFPQSSRTFITDLDTGGTPGNFFIHGHLLYADGVNRTMTYGPWSDFDTPNKFVQDIMQNNLYGHALPNGGCTFNYFVRPLCFAKNPP